MKKYTVLFILFCWWYVHVYKSCLNMSVNTAVSNGSFKTWMIRYEWTSILQCLFRPKLSLLPRHLYFTKRKCSKFRNREPQFNLCFLFLISFLKFVIFYISLHLPLPLSLTFKYLKRFHISPPSPSNNFHRDSLQLGSSSIRRVSMKVVFIYQ